jgi:hypothetical protein
VGVVVVRKGPVISVKTTILRMERRLGQYAQNLFAYQRVHSTSIVSASSLTSAPPYRVSLFARQA